MPVKPRIYQEYLGYINYFGQTPVNFCSLKFHKRDLVNLRMNKSVLLKGQHF